MNSNSIFDDILSHWPVGPVSSVDLISQGNVNRNCLIKTSTGAFILRKISHYRTIQQLSFEIAYLEHLENQHFPYAIPQLISSNQDQKFMKYEGSYYCVYQYIEGEVKKQLNLLDLRAIAKMVTSYHEILKNSALENGLSKDPQIAHSFVSEELADFKKHIKAKNTKNTTELRFLEYVDRLLSLHESLHDPTYSKYRTYPIHRDINPENLIWQGEELIGLIDYENVSMMNDTLLKDICVIIQTCCYNRNNPVQTDLNLASYFLKEYETYASLQKEDLTLLPKILSAGAIEDFAYAYWQLLHDPARADLSRLDYYANVAMWLYQHEERILSTLEKILSCNEWRNRFF